MGLTEIEIWHSVDVALLVVCSRRLEQVFRQLAIPLRNERVVRVANEEDGRTIAEPVRVTVTRGRRFPRSRTVVRFQGDDACSPNALPDETLRSE